MYRGSRDSRLTKLGPGRSGAGRPVDGDASRCQDEQPGLQAARRPRKPDAGGDHRPGGGRRRTSPARRPRRGRSVLTAPASLPRTAERCPAAASGGDRVGDRPGTSPRLLVPGPRRAVDDREVDGHVARRAAPRGGASSRQWPEQQPGSPRRTGSSAHSTRTRSRRAPPAGSGRPSPRRPGRARARRPRPPHHRQRPTADREAPAPAALSSMVICSGIAWRPAAAPGRHRQAQRGEQVSRRREEEPRASAEQELQEHEQQGRGQGWRTTSCSRRARTNPGPAGRRASRPSTGRVRRARRSRGPGSRATAPAAGEVQVPEVVLPEVRPEPTYARTTAWPSASSRRHQDTRVSRCRAAPRRAGRPACAQAPRSRGGPHRHPPTPTAWAVREGAGSAAGGRAGQGRGDCGRSESETAGRPR